MPRETLDIKKFNAGLITNADTKDIPLDAGTVGTKNLDANANGKLVPVKKSTEVNTELEDSKLTAWIYKGADDTYTLGAVTGAAIKYAEDFHNTPPSFNSQSESGQCIVAHNQAFHIGCGNANAKWLGYTNSLQFNGYSKLTYTGTGGDDEKCQVQCYGSHNYTTKQYFRVQIESGGSTFKVLQGTTSPTTTTHTGLDCLTTYTNIADNTATNYVYVRFTAVSGFTAGDYWDFTITPTVSTAIQYEDAAVTPQTDTGGVAGGIKPNYVSEDSGGTAYSSGQPIAYKCAALYDGVQLSPLSAGDPLAYHTVSAASADININVSVYDPESLNVRITAIGCYRALWQTSLTALGEFRLIELISVNDDNWYMDYQYARYDIVDDNNVTTSFEADSGFLQSIESVDVKYTVSTTINNYHFVGDCYHTELDDARYRIFRSKTYCYDSFDWVSDTLILSFVPKALAAFGGRIYAFDTTRMVRINPDGLFVEEEYSGVGTHDPRTIAVTPFGLFFANTAACYQFDGRQVIPISEPIKDQWEFSTTTYTNVATVFDTKTNQVLFFRSGSTPDSECYAYHVIRKRWDYIDFSDWLQTELITGAFAALATDDTYICTDATYQKLWAGDYPAWIWYSKVLDLNDASQKKRIYELEVDASATLDTQKVSIDGATFATLSPPTNGKLIQIQLHDTNGETVDSLSLIFRRFVGKR